jgi:hypothetical protein
VWQYNPCNLYLKLRQGEHTPLPTNGMKLDTNDPSLGSETMDRNQFFRDLDLPQFL